MNAIALEVASTEKAGVGGLIPSLATIFNNLQTTLLHHPAQFADPQGCEHRHVNHACVRLRDRVQQPVDLMDLQLLYSPTKPGASPAKHPGALCTHSILAPGSSRGLTS